MKPTDEIAEALAAFQAEAPAVRKTKTATVESQRGGYSYSYADLADMSATALPLLAKHGLAFTALPKLTERGPVLRGYLLHRSGQRLKGQLPLPGSTPQQLGSSLTYARRYLFGALTGLVTDDDDDGAAASRPAPRKRAQKRAERLPSAPPDDPWYDQPPHPPEARQISADQILEISDLFGAKGMANRDARRAYVRDVVGRQVAGVNDLTRGEADTVIGMLRADVGTPRPSGPGEPPGATPIPHGPPAVPPATGGAPQTADDRAALMAACSRVGIDPTADRNMRLALWTALLARPVTSVADLNHEEARTLLRRMMDLETGVTEWDYSTETGAVTLRPTAREPHP